MVNTRLQPVFVQALLGVCPSSSVMVSVDNETGAFPAHQDRHIVRKASSRPFAISAGLPLADPAIRSRICMRKSASVLMSPCHHVPWHFWHRP